jgi:hypothetical protein
MGANASKFIRNTEKNGRKNPQITPIIADCLISARMDLLAEFFKSALICEICGLALLCFSFPNL